MLWLFLLFFITPLVELYLLIKIGQLIGAGLTVLLVILTAVAGAALAKREGIGVWRRMHQQLSMGILPTDTLIEGVIILACGLLLITPGVITDSIALLLLLVPPLRVAAVKAIKSHFIKRIEVHFGTGKNFHSYYYHSDDSDIIDLPEDAYKVRSEGEEDK